MHAEDFFRPRLQRAGFTGAFWPKACSPAEQYGYPCDGCAIFFASERFELLGPPCGARPLPASPGWLQPDCPYRFLWPCIVSLRVPCNEGSPFCSRQQTHGKSHGKWMPSAGQPFYVASGGLIGKQGMLHVLLRDRRSGQRILVATTHLKAKGGQVGRPACPLIIPRASWRAYACTPDTPACRVPWGHGQAGSRGLPP